MPAVTSRGQAEAVVSFISLLNSETPKHAGARGTVRPSRVGALKPRAPGGGTSLRGPARWRNTAEIPPISRLTLPHPPRLGTFPFITDLLTVSTILFKSLASPIDFKIQIIPPKLGWDDFAS